MNITFSNHEESLQAYVDGVHFGTIKVIRNNEHKKLYKVALYYPGQLFSVDSETTVFNNINYAKARCEVFAESEYSHLNERNIK